MQRNKKTLLFEKKSHFNERRDSYVDENGNYVYTRMVKVGKNRWRREVVDIVPLTAENRDIIILLDQDDHDCDLQERYEEENADYGIRNQQNNSHGDYEDEDDFDTDPVENIPAPSGSIEAHLFQADKPVDPRVAEAEKFVQTELSEDQKNLFYAHMGEKKFLEDIRREEEAETGKKVTKQAVHNRWDRILTKACKHFGVEKPKQEHRKKDNQ